MFKRYLNNEKGFSMIEMMVVLIIIAVLIGGGIKFYLGYIENSRITKAKAQISTMQAALDAYYAENGKYPIGDDEVGLETALTNAGIKCTTAQDSKNEATCEQKDPWGKEYVYEVEDEENCKIYTGYNNDQDTENNRVVGNCSNGRSEPPGIEVIDNNGE